MSATCRSCGAAIVWATTVKGKPIPLDALPAADGNIALFPSGEAHVYTKSELERARPRTPLRKSHFATCPNAAQHRRPQEPA